MSKLRLLENYFEYSYLKYISVRVRSIFFIPVVNLCPNTPQLNAGIRADPPISVPRPKGLPHADTILA